MQAAGVIAQKKVEVEPHMSLFDFAAKVDPNFSDHHSAFDFGVEHNPYDHVWYHSHEIRHQLEDITVLDHKEGGSHKCNPFDLYTVQYQAWMQDPLEEGKQKLVLDSHNGKPMVF
jgi:hypothetical protein